MADDIAAARRHERRPAYGALSSLPDRTTDLDLADQAFVADPYPALAELRDRGPVVWHAPTAMWLATTHAAATAVLRDRRLGRIWSDREPATRFAAFNALHRHQMMENEPPVHTRLRRLVAAAFARGHVERMRPRVARLAADLLESSYGDSIDILAEYAEPLPVAVIADLLGVPEADRSRLRDWSQAIVRMYEYRRTGQVLAAAEAASKEFSRYVRGLVAERTARPRDDLISDLIAVRDSGGRLSEDELVASVVLLLNAGHEASVNAFGNGLVALLAHPDQRQRVTAGAVSVAIATEEMLRFDAPLQLFERTATEDVDVAGVPVRQGQKIAALLGSANRDPAVFAHADVFDAGRDPNPHVGFGMGTHFCLGAPLARVELEIALRTVLDRYPDIELVGTPRRRPTFVLRGYQRIDGRLSGPVAR
jgi:cytochrome P450